MIALIGWLVPRSHSARLVMTGLTAVLVVIGFSAAAWADPLPTGGTCTMLVVRPIPPPTDDNHNRLVSRLIAITFGPTLSVGFNDVKFSWNNQNDVDNGVVTQVQGVLSSVALTPNTSFDPSNPLAGNTYVLTGTTPKGEPVAANLVPVNNTNTILVQMFSPSAFSGVCQMQ
ncbi:MAG TPA: hypothetical protein VLY45_06520 [Nitrospiria bacterium]|nr:hypothetical protein [Nitrospiria bacterium]